MVPHSERLVPEMTQSERFESRAQVPAYDRDCPKILIEHGDQSAVAGALRLVAGSFVDLRCLIEIAAGLVNNSDDVQSLRTIATSARAANSASRVLA